MDGAHFRAAQQRLPDSLAEVPVIVVSGVDGADRQAARLNVTSFVPKPFDSRELLVTIRDHVGR
jgi:DNA-binding response OmpR family regulator